MNVLDVMSSKVYAIYKSETLAAAVQSMQTHQTRHLVVVELGGKLVGILSDRDCKIALDSPFNPESEVNAEEILVETFMSPAPTCISATASVQEAAHLMLEERIHALPVMNDGTVIGIVTSTDLLRVLASLPEIMKP